MERSGLLTLCYAYLGGTYSGAIVVSGAQAAEDPDDSREAVYTRRDGE